MIPLHFLAGVLLEFGLRTIHYVRAGPSIVDGEEEKETGEGEVGRGATAGWTPRAEVTRRGHPAIELGLFAGYTLVVSHLAHAKVRRRAGHRHIQGRGRSL